MKYQTLIVKNSLFGIPNNLDHAVRLAKEISILRTNATQLYGKCLEGYKIFVNRKKPGDSRDAGHRLRLFNDTFLQDAFKNHCIGTIYRTKKADEKIKAIEEAKRMHQPVVLKNTPIHCEHVLPNNILTKYIFYNQDIVTDDKLFEFLYKNVLVCAVDESEKPYINAKRSINDINLSWSKNHPEFYQNTADLLHNHIDFGSVRPFVRYKNTTVIEKQLKVYCLFKKDEIDLDSFTMKEHYEILNNSEELKKLNSLYIEAINKSHNS